MRWLNRGAALISTLTILAAVPAKASPERITVYAAASMTDVIDDAAAAFTERTGTEVRRVYAASSVIARQLAAGAPADIVISANAAWMNFLEKRDVLEPGTRRDIAGNRLVVIVPESSPITAVQGSQLGMGWIPERLAVGETSSVPAGLYAKEALTALGTLEPLRNSLVLAGSVRVALAWVVRGEVDAGIVYASDAAVTDRARRVWTIPDDSHSPIRYPAALLKGRHDAMDFLDFLTSEEGRNLFATHGFLPARGS